MTQLTLTPSQEAIVQSLLRAHQGGPLADDQAAQAHVTTLEQAYAVQEQLYVALGHAPNEVPRYWKSGGPTRNDPMRHAPLPLAGVRPSGSSLDCLHLPYLRNRWIEAEIALRIGQPVTPAMAQSLTMESARDLVDALTVSIELVDTRWAAGRAAPPLLKLADLQVHGALVLGDFIPYAPFRSHDWSGQPCRVRIGTETHDFKGSLGVSDPAWVLPDWLRHLTRHGATVPVGTVVTTGTWCGLLDAKAGDEVGVEFEGVGAAAPRF